MRNVLFLTLSNISNINESGIYQDLLREFARKGYKVFVVSAAERRNQEKIHLIKIGNANILRVKTGNIQKTNLFEKGIATVLLEAQYISAIKKYWSDVKFDLVLCSTPPVTLVGAIQYIKKRDCAKTYLLLKDLFPQNAVDLGMMSKHGIKGLLYWYFRSKEKKLYCLSDKIGCMSPGNVDYVLRHNLEITPDKVEVCPNCIEPIMCLKDNKSEIRKKYDFPPNKKIFVFGGNLGRPQDVPFFVECLRACADIKDSYFVVAGSGTDRHFLEEYVETEKPSHVKLLRTMSKDEYDRMIACCDVGLIFLDHRFTIPNFPSRLLSYMQAKLPVLAATDCNSDIGKMIQNGCFGWWVTSNSVEKFAEAVKDIIKLNLTEMGNNAFECLQENYTAQRACEIICHSIEEVAKN